MNDILRLVNELTALVQKENVAMVLFVDDKQKTTHYRCFGDQEKFTEILDYMLREMETDGLDTRTH